MLRNIFDNLDFLPFQFCRFVLLPRLENGYAKIKKGKKEKKKRKRLLRKYAPLENGDWRCDSLCKNLRNSSPGMQCYVM